MLNRKNSMKVALGLIPSVLGLVLCFNGLKNVEGDLEKSMIYAESKLSKVIEEATVKEEPVKKVEEKKIEDKTIETKELIVTAKSGLNVREDANTESKINTVYPFASRFESNTIKGDWYKTREGYVHKDYVMEFESAIETGAITDKDLELYDRLYNKSFKELNVAVTGISNLTLSDIQSYTNIYPGLRGIEEAAIRAEYEYGINAFATIAVASLESGYGSSDIAKDKNNLYGMNAQDHDPYTLAYSYNSKYNSAMDFARVLSTGYINKGLTTLDSIQSKYTSDPNWGNKVNTIMQKIYNVVMGNRSNLE
ncbi:glucosaminidase domain-containing protein [Romboutsia ilealis]|uniref:glucosaminidase domain-containing protein n=1 Tax=Romboutsia ilealis TaxID=1115758 RepID=UPI0027297A5B|nr:glucosaminidase domain-containing protein [Romboutsia ilealis]